MWILEQLKRDGVDLGILPNDGAYVPAAIILDPTKVRVAREFCLAPISASAAGSATTFTCGRKGCDLNFEDDKSVSRKHARFNITQNYDYTRPVSRPPLLVEDGVDGTKFSSYGTRVYRSDGCEQGSNKNRFSLVATLGSAHKDPFDLSRHPAPNTHAPPNYLVVLGRGWQGQDGESTVLRVIWQPFCVAHTSMPKDELSRCKLHAKALGMHIVSTRKGGTCLPDSTTHLAVGGGVAKATTKTLHALIRAIPLVAGGKWLSHVRDRLQAGGPLLGARAGSGADATRGSRTAALPDRTLLASAAEFAPRNLPPQPSIARSSLFAGCLCVFFGGSDSALRPMRDVLEAGGGKARRVWNGIAGDGLGCNDAGSGGGGDDDATLCQELLEGVMATDAGTGTDAGAGVGAVSTKRKPTILLISPCARVESMTERASMLPETDPHHADAGNERLCRVEALLARTAECRSNLVDVLVFDRESDLVAMMWHGSAPSTAAGTSITIGTESHTIGRRVIAATSPMPDTLASTQVDPTGANTSSGDTARAKATTMTATQIKAVEDADTEDDQCEKLPSPERHPHSRVAQPASAKSLLTNVMASQAPTTTSTPLSPLAAAPSTAGHVQDHNTTPPAPPEVPEDAVTAQQARQTHACRSAQKRKRPEVVPSSQSHRQHQHQRQRKAATLRAEDGWSFKQRSKKHTLQPSTAAAGSSGCSGTAVDEALGENAQFMAPTLLCDDLDDCLERDAALTGADMAVSNKLDTTAIRDADRDVVNFKAFRKTPYHPYAQEEVVETKGGAGHKVNLNRHHVNQLRRSYEQEEQREQRADELWREDEPRLRGRGCGRSRR